jgi:hypothetical protein
MCGKKGGQGQQEAKGAGGLKIGCNGRDIDERWMWSGVVRCNQKMEIKRTT